MIEPTVNDLAAFDLQRIIPGHCTGWRVTRALVIESGEIVIPETVGQTHRFG